MMRLQGSCHCGRVRFECESHEPVPFLRCYCSICRKLNGSGGFGINIGADFTTLNILSGAESLSVYSPASREPLEWKGGGESSGRHFCRICSAGLWNWDRNWPELFHPYASTIDSELPLPPELTHMMLGSKASWAEVQKKSTQDRCFDEYPDESLRQWHERTGSASE